jgi:hypothetical protein
LFLSRSQRYLSVRLPLVALYADNTSTGRALTANSGFPSSRRHWPNRRTRVHSSSAPDSLWSRMIRQRSESGYDFQERARRPGAHIAVALGKHRAPLLLSGHGSRPVARRSGLPFVCRFPGQRGTFGSPSAPHPIETSSKEKAFPACFAPETLSPVPAATRTTRWRSMPGLPAIGRILPPHDDLHDLPSAAFVRFRRNSFAEAKSFRLPRPPAASVGPLGPPQNWWSELPGRAAIPTVSVRFPSAVRRRLRLAAFPSWIAISPSGV